MAYVKVGKEKLKIKTCKAGRVKFHKTCQWCQGRFISNRQTAKFCSDSCKAMLWRYIHGRLIVKK